jgi:hypothetical protein
MSGNQHVKTKISMSSKNMKKPFKTTVLKGFGAGGRTRTPDLLITSQLLYQLSYTSINMNVIVFAGVRTVCLLSTL